MFSALFTLFPYSVTKTVTEDNPFLHSVDICPGPIRGLWASTERTEMGKVSSSICPVHWGIWDNGQMSQCFSKG